MILDSCEEKGFDLKQGAQSKISLWSRVENFESGYKHCELSGW